MARFYGISPIEAGRMPIDEFEDYYQAITILEARETLKDLRVSDWPHQSKDDRKQFHRELHKMAFPDVKSKPMTLDELRGILGNV